MSASVEPQTDAIDDEPLDSSTSLMSAQRVREVFLGRQHRHERAFGECAVADFAPSRRAHRPGLARRVRREVVVVHVALVGNRHDAVEPLLVADRTQGRRGEHLRLPARENARTVNARHVADLRPDRADLVGLAAVGTNLFVDDHHAQLLLFHRLDDLLEVFIVLVFEQREDSRIFGAELGDRRRARQLVERRIALELLGHAHRCRDFFFEVLLDPRFEFGIAGEQRIFAFGLAGFLCQLVDRRDDLLDLGVSELDRAQEIFLGDFVAAAFDHHHGIERSGDDDVHAAAFRIAAASDCRCTRRLHRVRRAPRRRSCRTGYRTRRAPRPAAQTAITSLSSSGSIDSTVVTICTSLRKPSWNSGRIGRSI